MKIITTNIKYIFLLPILFGFPGYSSDTIDEENIKCRSIFDDWKLSYDKDYIYRYDLAESIIKWKCVDIGNDINIVISKMGRPKIADTNHISYNIGGFYTESHKMVIQFKDYKVVRIYIRDN